MKEALPHPFNSTSTLKPFIVFKHTVYERALLELFENGKIEQDYLISLLPYLKPDLLNMIKEQYLKKDTISFDEARLFRQKFALSKHTPSKGDLDRGLNSLMLMSKHFEALVQYQATLKLGATITDSPLIPKNLLGFKGIRSSPFHRNKLIHQESPSVLFLDTLMKNTPKNLQKIILDEILIDLFSRIQIGIHEAFKHNLTHSKFAKLVLYNENDTLKRYFSTFAYQDSLLWQIFVDEKEPH